MPKSNYLWNSWWKVIIPQWHLKIWIKGSEQGSWGSVSGYFCFNQPRSLFFHTVNQSVLTENHTARRKSNKLSSARSLLYRISTSLKKSFSISVLKLKIERRTVSHLMKKETNLKAIRLSTNFELSSLLMYISWIDLSALNSRSPAMEQRDISTEIRKLGLMRK